MQTESIALLLGAAAAFVLQIQWLAFALLLLFVAISVVQQASSAPTIVPLEGAPQPQGQQMPVPPIFVQPTQDSAEHIKNTMMAVMMGNVMAADAMSGKQADPFGFLTRVKKWRQGPNPYEEDYAKNVVRSGELRSLRRQEKLLRKMLSLQAKGSKLSKEELQEIEDLETAEEEEHY